MLARRLRLAGDFDFRIVAKRTPGYVGADLAALCKEAAALAVKRIFSQLEQQEAQERAAAQQAQQEQQAGQGQQGEATGDGAAGDGTAAPAPPGVAMAGLSLAPVAAAGAAPGDEATQGRLGQGPLTGERTPVEQLVLAHAGRRVGQPWLGPASCIDGGQWSARLLSPQLVAGLRENALADSSGNHRPTCPPPLLAHQLPRHALGTERSNMASDMLGLAKVRPGTVLSLTKSSWSVLVSFLGMPRTCHKD